MAIIFKKKDHIAYITLSNPEKANIMDRETSEQLDEAWREIWDDHEIRVTILTGEGDRYFCAGHNLQPRPDVTPEEREYVQAERVFWPPSGTNNGQKIGLHGLMGDHFPRIFKPVVAAVNGWAAGAGFYTLLSTTDIRIASEENAKFKFALLSNGWVGGGPGATLLPRQINYVDAMKILLTDEPFGAEEALRIGLVNEVVPHARLMERSQEIADSIAAQPPLATRMMKELVIRFGEMQTDEAWRVQTLMNQLLTSLTTDGEEGRAAFLEKRKPNFTGGMRKKGEPFPELSPAERARIDELKRTGGA
ncbi:MAG: enoyl-CoA hydratase/isomerase family protein [Dehalococcoidia bacterium]|nr:enoyl-CoA hydratase/isomerase family protein [Dehalococcoidia bacterium]